MELFLKFLPVVVLVVILVALFLVGYVKAPPDKAYIITGFRKRRILIGRSGICIPFIERKDTIYLEQMSVDIKTGTSVPTNDFINVDVDAVAKIRILTDEVGLELASKNFLNKAPQAITTDLMDSLQGNMREIIGTLTLKEITTDRDSFSDEVVKKASKDMAKLGIEILSCNIQNVTDENGLIKDLGADNMALIRKNASIAKAQADKDVAVARAESDKQANDARILSETEIAQKNNELEIRKAELKIAADSKKAEADASYLLQEQEQKKKIETATVNAQIARTEREAELKKQEVEVTKQKLDSEIRTQADAERYRQEQIAAASLFTRQKESEAKLFEEKQQAEADKARAEANKYAKTQEAEGVKALGLAEAESIKAKALAEAEGIDKKAEAMKKMGEASVIDIIMKAMPEIAKNVAEPLSNVDKITMYGEGNATKMIEDIVNSTTQITEGMSAGMGIDLKSILSGFLGGKMAHTTPTENKLSLEVEDDLEMDEY